MNAVKNQIPADLVKLIREGKLYGYISRPYGFTGIVVAENEAEAKAKVYASYTEHGFKECDFFDTIVINKIDQIPFKDSPDILETCEVEE